MSNGDAAEVEQEPESKVVCKKVHVSFCMEEMKDGKFFREFTPETVVISECDFEEPLDLKKMADTFCEQALAAILRGDVQWGKR